MKKILFDTSILIAGTFKSHVHHSQSVPWLHTATDRKIKAFISTHNLAELYTHISKPLYDIAASPASAQQLITQWIVPYFQTIELNRKDYQKAIGRVVERSLRGAIIYDALHIQAALKKKVDAIITLNETDFARLIKPGEINIINPLNTSPH